MDKIVLHTCVDSPPGRAIQMALAHLKLAYEIKNVDYDHGEHFSAEYLKVTITVVLQLFELLSVYSYFHASNDPLSASESCMSS